MSFVMLSGDAKGVAMEVVVAREGPATEIRPSA